MNDTPPFSDDDDALAAEYVIGLLDHAARDAAANRLRRDAAFAARVSAWEGYLEDLNREYGTKLPPARVKRLIDQQLFGKQRRTWFGWIAPGLAVAAILLAAFLLPLLTASGPELQAQLQSDDTPYVFTASVDLDSNQIEMALLAGEEPTSETFELWLIPDGGAPQSLGVFAADETVVLASDIGLTPSATLAISLEPLGGSPTGAPTGPVLAVGVLEDV